MKNYKKTISKEIVKELIHGKINEASFLIPQKDVPDLQPSKTNNNAPQWHDFEMRIWKLGEEIRPLLAQHPKLRADKELTEMILEIALDSKAKRGRQSFIMLLGYKIYKALAPELIKQLNDKFVDGHVLSSIYKMQADGFVKEIKPFTKYPITWIRNYAKKYVQKYR